MMMQAPGPTVLLATFNGAASLREQLDSYLVQTVPIERIIASDDGSQDGTLDILTLFAREHPEIQLDIVSGPRRGAAQNFLHLLRCLPDNAGPVLFSDQDDVWLPQKVAAGLTLLAQHPSDQPVLVGGRTFVCDHALRKLHLSRLPDLRQVPSFRHALVQSFAGGNTMICNAAAAHLLSEAAHEARRIVMHDWWAYQIVCGVGGVVIYDPEPYVMYRQHPRNLIGDNRGLAAEINRLLWLFKGRFRRWNVINIKALRSSFQKLTPENRSLLENFAGLQRANLVNRIKLMMELRLFRNGLLGPLSIWVAVIFGRT